VAGILARPFAAEIGGADALVGVLDESGHRAKMSIDDGARSFGRETNVDS